MIEVPLFPLHAVLCPGVSMPVHVFEPRYRALVRHCLAENAPFGIVLIREGREVGGGTLAVAEVGTFAEIREASRYADGRYDLVVHGAGRFRLDRVIVGRDPFIVGVVEPIDDEVGDADAARGLAVAVTRRFIRYLELLQPAEGEADDDAIVLGLEADDEPDDEPDDDADADAEPTPDELAAIEAEAAEIAGAAEGPGPANLPEAAEAGEAGGFGLERAAEALDVPSDVDPEAAPNVGGIPGAPAEETLEIASAELTIPDEPTALSFLLTGIVELDLPRRQALLEASTTELRLAALAAVLDREIELLGRRLRIYSPDLRIAAIRRN